MNNNSSNSSNNSDNSNNNSDNSNNSNNIKIQTEVQSYMYQLDTYYADGILLFYFFDSNASHIARIIIAPLLCLLLKYLYIST